MKQLYHDILINLHVDFIDRLVAILVLYRTLSAVITDRITLGEYQQA